MQNWGINRMEGDYGWRISIAGAGIPAILLTVGALIVDDTPNSLIERGFEEKGKAVLRKIRGVENIEPEFQDILKACKVANEVKSPAKDLFKRHNRPPLIIAFFMQVRTY